MAPPHRYLPLCRASLVLALFLALAAPAHAQTPSPYVKYRVEIDAPPAVQELLRGGLDLYRWQDYETMTPELLERLMREAEIEARDILAANGYFSAGARATLDAKVDPQIVRIAVDPGEPTRVAAIDLRVSGPIDDDPALRESVLKRLHDDWLLPVGAVFTQAEWNRAKQRAVEIASERHYAAARVGASEARIDPEQRTARLALTIESGPALRFGELRVVGTAHHDEARVRDLWTFAPGEPYDREKLDRFQRRLAATSYFASVQVTADTAAARAGEVPIRVSVIEAPRQRLELSLGFSTDTGLRGGFDWRYNDFLARDWRLRLTANVETLQQFAEAAIDLPERPSGWADTVGIRGTRTDIENLRTEEMRIGARTTAVEERSRPAFGAAYILSRQTPSGFAVEEVYATYLDYVHTWRTTDDLLSPRRGWVVQTELGGGVPGLSTRGFGRTIGRVAWYGARGPANDFSLRTEAGAVLAEMRDGIPESLLFRVGGATTVRGYNYESLGVEQGEAVVGGRYYALASAEYTRWVLEGLGIATFIDAGNAVDDLSGLRLSLGYGLGMRFRSPIGPFRLDVAYGHDDGKIRIHFSVGLSF